MKKLKIKNLDKYPAEKKELGIDEKGIYFQGKIRGLGFGIIASSTKYTSSVPMSADRIIEKYGEKFLYMKPIIRKINDLNL